MIRRLIVVTIITLALAVQAVSASDWESDDLSPAPASPGYDATQLPPPGQAIGLSPTQKVALLESVVLGKTYDKDGLIERIKRLETTVYPNQDRSSQPLARRVDNLVAAIQPDLNAPAPPALNKSNANWLTSPAPIPWLNKIGRGVSKAGKGVLKVPQKSGEATSKVLTSPGFWAVTGGAAAVTGLYFMGRGKANDANQAALNERGCTGSASCQYCTNCHYCKNCNMLGGSPCGVRVRLTGTAQ